MRLDKYLSEMGILTRSQTKKEIKKKQITVNGAVATKPEYSINPEVDVVAYCGKRIAYEPFVYYLLHKPQDVISATEDRDHKTVIDLLHEQYPEEGREIFPVGRLDIDTEGLLLLTNDGALSHDLLSPSKHVEKTYLVGVEGRLMDEDIRILEEGVDIGDEDLTKPAKVVYPLSEDQTVGKYLTIKSPAMEAITEEDSYLLLTITEGRYHQVKRMLAKVGHPVKYLKRISFGAFTLDDELKIGDICKLIPVTVENNKCPQCGGELIQTVTACCSEGYQCKECGHQYSKTLNMWFEGPWDNGSS